MHYILNEELVDGGWSRWVRLRLPLLEIERKVEGMEMMIVFIFGFLLGGLVGLCVSYRNLKKSLDKIVDEELDKFVKKWEKNDELE